MAGNPGKLLPLFDPKKYSSKASDLDKALIEATTGKPQQLLQRVLVDKELLIYQQYANSVAVTRLHYNDHGPVHMRITALNSLKILRHLIEGGVEMSLKSEGFGDVEDSEVAVLFGALVHDIGIGVTRMRHEWHSINLADPFLDRYLGELYPDDTVKRCVVRALVHEIIIGHMATEVIHSIEAGILLVADGTDMTQGRSRLVGKLLRDPAIGDMHKHSADAVKKVTIGQGAKKPVLISIEMIDYAGIFQVEEVLLPKVAASTIKQYLEICVKVKDDPPRYYLE
jgi:metal-dependent HD superfamily phosphatase/phosphodiesterase